ncbi:MAG TPA: alpha/beta fold hydrolase [Azoarcus taiwanensis]|nr:alpha/beta fold hydrolase [Azoarcus taiwanensis]
MNTYRAPWWLPGGHAETLYPLTRKGVTPPYRRQRVDTPDGDFVDIDWLDVPSDDAAPLVLLFHGLEGSSRSHYARSLMRAVAARRWKGAVLHFRGCSGSPNRLPRAYHSGDSQEIDWALAWMRLNAGDAPLFAVGVSLGGNALLKWLGEQETAALQRLDAAAAVCPPLDLTRSGLNLGRGLNRIYTRHFLQTLIPKALEKAERFPGHFDGERISRAASLQDFDDVYTAPAHGFADVFDYWRRASAKPWLGGIHLPTLLLNAANDPFVPSDALPTARDLGPGVGFECPPRGGHVGFLHGNWPGSLDWLPQRLLAHFDRQR